LFLLINVTSENAKNFAFAKKSKLSKAMFAIDFGNDTIKAARWEKSSNDSFVDSAEIVKNDFSYKRSPYN